MKNWILILIVVFGAAWAINKFLFNPHPDAAESSEDPTGDAVSSESELIEGRVKVNSDELAGLSAELLADPYVKEIVANAHGDFQDFVATNQERIEAMLPAAAKLVLAIRDCDAKDHCGEAVRDQTRTQHQQLLAGALALIGESYRVLGKRQDLSPGDLASLLKVRNDEVQSLVADVIAYSVDGAASLKAALVNWNDLTDSAMSTVAQSTEYLSREDSALRSAWINALSQWLEQPDHNPEPFYSNLSLLELSEGEFQQLSKGLCRFAGQPEKKEIYAVLKFKLASYAQGQGWGGFAEESCPK
jgi:hypothetical protein